MHVLVVVQYSVFVFKEMQSVWVCLRNRKHQLPAVAVPVPCPGSRNVKFALMVDRMIASVNEVLLRYRLDFGEGLFCVCKLHVSFLAFLTY